MRRPLLGACLLFVLLVLAFYLCVPYKLPDYSSMDEQFVQVSGEVAYIETKESFGATSIVYTLKNVHINGSRADDTDYKHSQIYCYASEKFERTYIGSKIAVKGDFSSFKGAENPGSFDGQLYYHILGMGGSLRNTQLISTDGSVSYLKQALLQIRFFFLQKINQLFEEPYNGIIQAVLLGYKENLDKEVKELYKEGGMLHIMTISGMHISMLGMGCYNLFRKVKVPTKLSAALGSVIVVMYGLMIGMQVATFRAVFMFAMRMLAIIRGRTYDAKTALGLSAAVLLLKQPMYLFSSGFLLSYGSVFGVVMVAPILAKLLKCKQPFVGKIAGKLIASLGILLATLPIQLYFFYEYSLYSIWINFLVLPLFPYVVGIAVVVLVCPLSLRHVILVLTFMDEKILQFYEGVCRFFEKMPYHQIVAGAPKPWQILVYYLVLVLCLYFLDVSFRKHAAKRRRVLLLLPILASVIAILFWRPLKGFRCHFLSVGQGDCAIFFEGNSAYLVDCGSSSKRNVAEDVLLPFLKYYGVSEVDGVFLSHADEDHINGVVQWLENYEHSHVEMGSVILPALDAEVLQAEFGKVLVLCDLWGIPVFTLKAGDKLSVGELQLEVLNPNESIAGSNSNDMSQVLLWQYKEHSILMTGDVSTKIEELFLSKLPERGISVLKVAHHGSKYSSSSKFLETTSPQIAIISAGKDNRYGHPHKEVLERLNEQKTLVMETAKSGAVKIVFGKRVEVAAFHE